MSTTFDARWTTSCRLGVLALLCSATLALPGPAWAKTEQPGFGLPGAQASKLQRKARVARFFRLHKLANRYQAQGVVATLGAVTHKLEGFQAQTRTSPYGRRVYVINRVGDRGFAQAGRAEVQAIAAATTTAADRAADLVGKPGVTGAPIAAAARRTLELLGQIQLEPQHWTRGYGPRPNEVYTERGDRQAIQALNGAAQRLKLLPLRMALHDSSAAPR